MTLTDPAMRNDSIVSSEAGVVAWAARDIRFLEVRRFSPGKTIGLFVVAVALAAGWTRAAAGSSGGTPPDRPPPLPKP